MALATEVYLCKNTKLFPGCEDNYYFSNETTRKNFFMGKSSGSLHFTAISYVRETRSLKLPIGLVQAEECDYLMFNNPAYENKWIYAFIEKCRYINDEVTEVIFKVDNVQTWGPSCVLGKSYIERAISGENTKWNKRHDQDEYITGIMAPFAEGKLTGNIDYDTEYICIVTNAIIAPADVNTEYGSKFWAMFNKKYGQNCGRGDNLLYYICKKDFLTGSDDLATTLAAFVSEAVAGSLFNDKYRVFQVMMVPAICLPSDAITALETEGKYNFVCVCPDPDLFDTLFTEDGNTYTYTSLWEDYYTHFSIAGEFTPVTYSAAPRSIALFVSWETASANIFGGHTVVNNRLYSSPYCRLRIHNNMGEGMDLRVQDFDGFRSSPQDLYFRFLIYGILSISPDIVLYPSNYLGSGMDVPNYNYRLSLSPYPQLPYNEDSFSQWLQQNNISNSIKGAQGLLQIGMGAAAIAGSGGVATPVAAGMITGGIGSLASLGIDFGRAKSEGISTNIPSNSGASATGLGLHHFTWQMYSLRNWDANSVDDFLSIYGEVFNGVSEYHFNLREKWDYVKMREVSFASANAPGDAIADLTAILKRGLRLWHGNYLGDYSQSNTIAP